MRTSLAISLLAAAMPTYAELVDMETTIQQVADGDKKACSRIASCKETALLAIPLRTGKLATCVSSTLNNAKYETGRGSGTSLIYEFRNGCNEQAIAHVRLNNKWHPEVGTLQRNRTGFIRLVYTQDGDSPTPSAVMFCPSGSSGPKDELTCL